MATASATSSTVSNPYPQVVVIGISGATRSGKGTLARNLHKALGSTKLPPICQDKFFDVTKIYKELGGNWDTPNALDHRKMYSKVLNIMEEASQSLQDSLGDGDDEKEKEKENGKIYIILEGFMLFYDPQLLGLIKHKIWIEINEKTCYHRRMTTKKDPEDYFHEKLWPNYLEYRKQVMGSTTLKNELYVVKGTLKPEKVLQKALVHIGELKATNCVLL